jgi:hypothetical protein
MISELEKEEIINAAIERVLLRLPEIIGNLITNHATKLRLNKEFYEKYPDLKDHRNIVAATIERIEGDDPSKSIQDIMTEAVPEVRRQLKNLKNLNIQTVSKPKMKYDIGDV